jgi:RNA polymerase sigma factor (sigma-70 family)
VIVNHDDNEDAQFEALLERSSLGAPAARQLRERIPLAEAEAIIRLSAPSPTSIGSQEEFFTRYWPRLLCVLIIQASDSGLAEDAASDAFMAAWNHWDTLQTCERPDSWLFKVAIRRLRRLEAKARKLSALNDDLASGEAELQDAAAGSEWVERNLDLVAALRVLPRRQAEIVALSLLQGYTPKETSEILGIAVGTVKSQLSQARNRLRVLLQVDQGPPDVQVDQGPQDAMRENPTVTPEDALRAAASSIGQMPEAEIQHKFAQLQAV